MKDAEVELHIEKGKAILALIEDLPTWQFGALMTSLISSWFLSKVAPADRGQFLSKLMESLSKRFPEAVTAVKLDELDEDDRGTLQ